jgi:uncharacterized membrane protein YqgA involved in biofilm formation
MFIRIISFKYDEFCGGFMLVGTSKNASGEVYAMTVVRFIPGVYVIPIVRFAGSR